MATTTAGRELTRQHRQLQLRVRAAAVADTIAVWAAFDPSNIDASWRAIEPGVEAIVRDYRSQSSAAASGYVQAHRTAEGVPGQATPRQAIPPSREVLRYSLGYYGVVVPNQLRRAGRLDVSRQAGVHLVGGVSRHVLDGGRETVIGSVESDRRARGWQRVTDASPCSFCAMLASRGATYSEQTVGFEAHDHCVCTGEPVYSRNDEREDAAREWQQLWNESTRGLSGDEARKAFRRAYEAR